MFMLIFRGIFLIGILSWYSTNVWKMIDGYFKDRFDRYLQLEYRKNPKMRDDIVAHGASGNIMKDEKMESARMTRTISSMSKEHSCEVPAGVLGEDQVCSIDGASNVADDDKQTGSQSSSMLMGKEKEKSGDDYRSSDSEVSAKGADNKNIFSESSRLKKKVENEFSTNGDETPKSPLTEPTFDDDKLITKTRKAGSEISEDRSSRKKETRKKKKLQRKPIRKKIDEENEVKGRKKKMKTIVFTEEDFKRAKIRAGSQDYDFSEFDDDDEDDTREESAGILVSELPFKPRADIGKLERVNDDEFCPLTIEDEAHCDEIGTWP